MGLIEGDLDLDRAAEMAAVLRPVMYDPTTTTLYELEDVPDELRAWSLHMALDMALIDQHFSWSEGLDTARALGSDRADDRCPAVTVRESASTSSSPATARARSWARSRRHCATTSAWLDREPMSTTWWT